MFNRFWFYPRSGGPAWWICSSVFVSILVPINAAPLWSLDYLGSISGSVYLISSLIGVLIPGTRFIHASSLVIVPGCLISTAHRGVIPWLTVFGPSGPELLRGRSKDRTNNSISLSPDPRIIFSFFFFFFVLWILRPRVWDRRLRSNYVP